MMGGATPIVQFALCLEYLGRRTKTMWFLKQFMYNITKSAQYIVNLYLHDVIHLWWKPVECDNEDIRLTYLWF